MAIRKILARTFCAASILTGAACADGTGKALTPTLPSPDAAAANADGTRLKASAPEISSPRGANRVNTLTPQLTITNASAMFESGATLAYQFQVFDGATMIIESESVAAGDGQTSWTVPANLLRNDKTYGWRGRGVFNGVDGTWTGMASFRTPLPVSAAPESPGPVPCGGNTGHAIIACVAAAYPEKLVATADGAFSDERRYANMEFLRDRIIETGQCKGLDLGLNRKRGTEVISRDFIVYRSNKGKGGRDRGVDIASGYDAVKNKLKLTWQLFDDGPNYGHPFYKDYGKVDCSGVQ